MSFDTLFFRDADGETRIQRGTDVVLLDTDDGAMEFFRKHALTKAMRVEGPFRVHTSEGPLDCRDGWLAFDARGYPYPIAADEFELIYQPADPDLETPVAATFVERLEEIQRDGVHPATVAVLRFFAWDHLPGVLQEVSRPFGELALDIAARADGPEGTVALRKLLEAKDCAVRAALPPAPAYPLVERV